MMELEDDPRSAFDVEHYRKFVLEIILKGLHVTEKVYKLRLSLFIRAANYYFETGQSASDTLEPFKWLFYDPVKNKRKFDDLKQHILNIPKLTDFTEQTSLPKLTWQLLHWIFTNPLDIVAVEKSEISEYETEVIRETTKLPTIPYPSNFCTIFDITHPYSGKKNFIARKKQYGTFFAYHGSQAQNFHSIVHRGLICALNKVSAYGVGTYLSTNIETATCYSKTYLNMAYSSYGSYNLKGNLSNLAGTGYCIAVVEVVRDPSIKVVDFNEHSAPLQSINADNQNPNFDYMPNLTKYFVVNNDELMRLRHLLVFDQR